MSGFDYDWTFDGIGSRKKASVNSSKTGYVADQLNKYTKTFTDTDGDGVQDVGAKSTGGPTADYYKAGSDRIDVKIRLGQGGTP